MQCLSQVKYLHVTYNGNKIKLTTSSKYENADRGKLPSVPWPQKKSISRMVVMRARESPSRLLTSSHRKLLSLVKVITTDISVNKMAKWLETNREKCAGGRVKYLEGNVERVETWDIFLWPRYSTCQKMAQHTYLSHLLAHIWCV
jgi:hypothetical protein